MQNKNVLNIQTLCVCLLLFLLTGCAGQLSNVGKTAVSNDTLPLQVKAAESQEWQTADLRVTYDVNRVQSSYNISGTLTLRERIYYSFPQTDYFYFYINFLDKNNRVISSHDITPNTRFLLPFQDTFTLRSAPDAPANAVSFVFSYWGNFEGLGSENEDTGSWEIFYNPFLNNS